jgi:nucleoid-associated protein YgaU|tara:strand:+ start:264 stop:536 length:273 start_codon:yes stop_codon:yes gene_type:complete
MATRYNLTNLSIKKRKTYYNTTIYEKVPEKNTDQYFIAVDGDRCDNLAQEFYGNPNLWWFIARVNNLTTMNIPAGTSLRIPIDTEFAEGL